MTRDGKKPCLDFLPFLGPRVYNLYSPSTFIPYFLLYFVILWITAVLYMHTFHLDTFINVVYFASMCIDSQTIHLFTKTRTLQSSLPFLVCSMRPLNTGWSVS